MNIMYPLGPSINQIVWCFSLDYPTTRHGHLWKKCNSITEIVDRWMIPLFLPIIITAEDAASDGKCRNFSRTLQGQGLGPGKQRSRISWTAAASGCSSTVSLYRSQYGAAHS